MVQCKAAGFWCWMLCMHSEAFYFFSFLFDTWWAGIVMSLNDLKISAQMYSNDDMVLRFSRMDCFLTLLCFDVSRRIMACVCGSNVYQVSSWEHWF